MEEKNFKVKVLYSFRDVDACLQRNVGDEFWCTKSRYEYLKNNNAVDLVEEKKEEQIKNEKPKYFTSKRKKKSE